MPDQLPWEPVFAQRADRFAGSEIRELLKLLGRGNIISFAGGIPDPELFAHEAIRSAADTLLADPMQRQLALQTSTGKR